MAAWADAFSKVRAGLAGVRRQFSPRARRSWLGTTRAHVEVRDVRGAERAALERSVAEDVGALTGVRAVRFNAATGRVVVDIDAGGPSLDEIVTAVEQAETTAGFSSARFRDTAWEHPADREATERLIVALCADAVGVISGTALRFSLVPASRLSGTLASLLQILQTSPRLRRGLDERFGPLRADLALEVGAALAHGVAQRPGSALVELVHRALQLGETSARRRSWDAREADLFDPGLPVEPPHAEPDPRPCPLPRGPIEEYSDRAVWVSLAGFGVSFVVTRSLQRAVAALFGGLPKPAELGRDVFACELGRLLAGRGVLVLDPAVLRKLDRIDCLVLPHDLVARHRWEVRALVREPDIEEASVRALVADLFDPDQPVRRQERDGAALEPLGAHPLELSAMLSAGAAELGTQGGLVLALSRAGAVRALVEIEIVSRTGIDELMAAAHESGMRVVVAAATDAALDGFPADDIIPGGEGMVLGIRRLQREGRGVCVISGGATAAALSAADCGIGLLRPGEPAPWGAHLVCEEDLSEPRFLIHACRTARQVSKQSVNMALGAATLGALVSAGGVLPTTGRRVIAVVNAASLLSMLNGARTTFKLARQKLPPPRDRKPWHARDVGAVRARLGTSGTGLERKEALARRRPEHVQRGSVVELVEAIGDELFNPLAPLLAAGAGLSAAVGSFGDATMVGGVVALNAVIGGVQRHRTERAIRDLSRSARRRAMVRRAGQLFEVDAEQLVHGDLILLAAGDVVPADCRIVESESLEIDASSMTGESMPVKKQAAPSFEVDVPDRSSMLYAGTAIAAGRVTAVAVAVGDETEARRGSLLSKRDGRGGVERRLRSLIQLTGPVALGAGVGLVTAGLVRGRKLEDLVGSGVSLAVASVPEGLPLLATAAQLAAAERLAKRGALVRNARSIEALGRVDVLCLDKTGTLTEGRIELVEVSDGESLQVLPELDAVTLPILAAALRASADRGGRSFDPTEQALYRAADRMEVRTEYACAGFARAFETSFEAGRGYHATVGNCEAGVVLDVKGAPEVVLARCTGIRRGGQRVALDEGTSAVLARAAGDLAVRGLRVLAVAERIVPQGDSLDPRRLVGLTFLGFLAFSDPVRKTATQAVKELREAGVRTVMITGDHARTAEAVAREVGLPNPAHVLTGAELAEVDDEMLDRRMRGVSVFARVTPAQKVRIVRALQRAGRVVAMVGDGANDAAAIRLAHVGIAVGEQSTSAARAAADIVLIDARLETLVDAVLEGRAMWVSVRDAVSILVGGNLGEIGFMLGAGLLDGRPPLNARQLLLVNLLTDVAPAMAIALRPPAQRSLRSLAHEGPDISLGSPLNRQIAARAAVTAAGAGLGWTIARFTGTRARANTVGLIALVGAQLGQTLLSGRMSRPVVVTGIASAAILGAIVQTPGLSQAFGCRPLGPVGWLTAVGASAAATAGAAYLPDLWTRFVGVQGPEVVVFEEAPTLIA